MANLSYKKNTTKSFTVKGILSDDAKEVSYDDKEMGHVIVNLSTYLNEFSGEHIQLSIKSVSEDELELPDEEIDIEDLAPDMDM